MPFQNFTHAHCIKTRSPASARTKTRTKSRRCQTSPRRSARSLEARCQAASKTPSFRRISDTSTPRARRRCAQGFTCCLTPSPVPSRPARRRRRKRDLALHYRLVLHVFDLRPLADTSRHTLRVVLVKDYLTLVYLSNMHGED